MSIPPMSLARQVHTAFNAMSKELSHVKSGQLFIQIRNSTIGKFGIRHESNPSQPQEACLGLTNEQQLALRDLALKTLHAKKGWTHGELQLDFKVKNGILYTSTYVESNYNFAALEHIRKERNA